MSACDPAEANLRQSDVVCRDGDFVKQQQVALRLQKLDSPKAHLYAWWVIISLVLQARAAKAGHHPDSIFYLPPCR